MVADATAQSKKLMDEAEERLSKIRIERDAVAGYFQNLRGLLADADKLADAAQEPAPKAAAIAAAPSTPTAAAKKPSAKTADDEPALDDESGNESNDAEPAASTTARAPKN